MRLNMSNRLFCSVIIKDTTEAMRCRILNYLQDCEIEFHLETDGKNMIVYVSDNKFPYDYLIYHNIEYEVCNLRKEINSNRKRFVGLLSVFVIVITLSYISTKYVWEVRFEGNNTITDEKLYAYLEQLDIKPGTRKSEINCDKLEGQFRQQFDKIAWISGRIDGGRMTFGIKESLLNESKVKIRKDKNIYAKCDGVVKKIVVRTGTPMVKEGDTVCKGDIIIDSKVVVSNEFGEETGVKEVYADGIVECECKLDYLDTIKLNVKKVEVCFPTNEIWAIDGISSNFMQKRITSNSDAYIISNTTQLKLFDSIYLPIYLTKYKVFPYKSFEYKYTNSEAEKILNNRIENYLSLLEQKGVQIKRKNVRIKYDGNSCSIMGIITVYQDICTDISG